MDYHKYQVFNIRFIIIIKNILFINSIIEIIIVVIILIICCCCCILGGGGYYYINYMAPASGSNASAPTSGSNASAPTSGSNASAPTSGSNASAPASGSNASAPASGSNASAQAPTISAPTTTPAPTTPALPTYTQAGGDKWWGGEGPNQYTCPGAKGRNTTGNNNDFNRYCIFNKETDAKAFCSSDTSCKGYIKNNNIGNMFQATSQPVANPNVNSAFSIKILPTAPAISYLETGEGWWGGEGPNQYTCPGAKGRNVTGNNGDFNRYCIFDNETDAKEWCSSDASCKSIIKDNNPNRSIVSATRQPVLNPGFNSSHFIKLVK